MDITQKQVNAATNALLKHAQNLGKQNVPNWLIDSKLVHAMLVAANEELTQQLNDNAANELRRQCR